MKNIFVTVLVFFISQNTFAVQFWLLQQDKSAITFTASYDDVSFEGVFSDFDVALTFDPEELDNSHVKSTVNVTSVNTQSRDRDQALSEPDWFYFKKFPQATFISQTFESVKANQFAATGILQIRDQQHEVTIPFEWTKIDNKTARLKSQFSLDRRNYDIGTGDWKNDKTIGFEVIVNLTLEFRAN